MLGGGLCKGHDRSQRELGYPEKLQELNYKRDPFCPTIKASLIRPYIYSSSYDPFGVLAFSQSKHAVLVLESHEKNHLLI